jgi:hypothetical protein
VRIYSHAVVRSCGRAVNLDQTWMIGIAFIYLRFWARLAGMEIYKFYLEIILSFFPVRAKCMTNFILKN